MRGRGIPSDINGLIGCDALEITEGGLAIGCRVRHIGLQRNQLRGRFGAMLRFVGGHIAHHPIRTRGTFCGSLAHADPASEWCLVAATLGASMRAERKGGRRVVDAPDYFLGVMATALQPDELLTAVRLPVPPDDTRFGFFEFSRRAGRLCVGHGAGRVSPGRRRHRRAEGRPWRDRRPCAPHRDS